MTAIAYRDGIMAADTGTFAGSGTIVDTTSAKVVRTADGSLLGTTGTAHHCEEFRAWAQDGFDPRAYPRGLKEFEAIVVRPDGRVYYYFERPTPLAHGGPWAVAGSCEDLLFGALAHGATAEQAVAIAIAHHSDAAGHVFSLRLQEEG